jgi:hypothetical protein
MSDNPIRFTAKMKGSSDVIHLLNRYPEKVGRTLESLVRQEARGLAVELARNTRPFGFSDKAKQRGEKAVAKDIYAVYYEPSDAYGAMKSAEPETADKFWANITKRRFAQAQKVLQSSRSSLKNVPVGRLDPKWHREARTGPYANVRARQGQPRQIVTSSKALDTYINRIMKRVGFAKGSWLNAAKAIGGRVRGAAQWASRHKTAPGTATVKTGDKPSVTLINSLGYIDQACPPSSVDRALEHAAGRLRRALATSLRKIADGTNRALSSRRAG